jgi:predicted nucleic acid-binding protein
MSAAVESIAYLDANAFIGALEGEESFAAPIREVFIAGSRRPGALVTSELTLAEVLGPSKGQGRPPPLQRLYLDLMIWGRFIDLQPVSRELLLETVELRKYAPLKLPDAIHLATAMSTRCRFFVSRDRDFNRLPDWMEGISLHREGLAKVAAAVQ